MSEKSIQEQINDINRKLDILLEESAIQRQNREAVNDLVDDVAVIGKDAFRHLVTDLDNAGIELDGDDLRRLILSLIRNLGNLGSMLETIESLNDLISDITPIVRQMGLDGIKKFHEFEQKGYFEILNQLGITLDTIVSRYSPDQIKQLSGNLVPVADTLFAVADKDVLDRISAIMNAWKEIKPEDIEEYSIWRLMRQLNKPEVRKSFGFIMAFLAKINEAPITSKQITN